MKITAQQYILNKKGEGSFVVVYKSLFSSRDEKSKRDADIYILFKVGSEKEIPFQRISKFIVEAIVDGYLYSISKTTNQALKESLDEGVNKAKNLVKNDKDLEETGLDLSFTVILVKKEGVYIGNVGENDIYICKKNKSIDISEIMKNRKANSVGVVLEENESLIASTSGLISSHIKDLSLENKRESISRKLATIATKMNVGSGILFLNALSADIEESRKIGNVERLLNTENSKQKGEIDVKEKFDIRKILPKMKVGISKIFSKVKVDLPSVKVPQAFSTKGNTALEKIKKVFSEIFNFLKKIVNALKFRIDTSLRNKRWYKKIGARLSQVKINSPVSKRVVGIRIDDYKIKNLRLQRFKMLFGIALILVLVALGINFTRNMKHDKAVSKSANEKFETINGLLVKAESSASTDRSGAEIFLFQIKNIIKDIPDNLKEKDKKRLEDLNERYTKLSDSFYKKVPVSIQNGKLEEYINPRLTFGEGSVIADIEMYRNKAKKEYLLVADSGRKAIYYVNLSDKTFKTIPDGKNLVKEPKYISVGVEGVYIFDEKSGVLKSSYNPESVFSEITAMAGLSRNDIKEKDISSMIVLTDADAIYLLSKDRGSIMKSSPAYSNRYGLLFSYIENKSFTEGVDLMADLSVYILTNSNLIRYSWNYVQQKQAENPLAPAGLTGDYGNILCGYTYGEDLKSSIFLFDSNAKRVLKFEKPIESGAEARHPNQILLLNQYEYRGNDSNAWSNVKDIVADLPEKNIYIAENSVIWKISL